MSSKSPVNVAVVSQSKSLMSVSSLSMIAGLFILSFLTDLLTKDILLHHPYPLTLTLAQFSMSAIGAGLVLMTVHPKFHRITLSSFRSLTPIVLSQLIGFLTTNLSLAALPVAFIHTVKASEALFTAFVSRVCFKMQFSWGIYLSLIPIVAGVAVSSLTEMSFDKFGFLAALTSNACFACRTVFSGTLMKQEQDKAIKSNKSIKQSNNQSNNQSTESRLDDVNLYFYISLFAALLLLPIWYHFEYAQLPPLIEPFLMSLKEMPSFSTLASLPRQSIGHAIWLMMNSSYLMSLIVNGFGHYSYNQCSFLLLGRVAPITHVVIQALRRLAVIYMSVMWLSQPLTPISVVGTILVVGGVIAFGLEKGKMNQKKDLQKVD